MKEEEERTEIVVAPPQVAPPQVVQPQVVQPQVAVVRQHRIRPRPRHPDFNRHVVDHLPPIQEEDEDIAWEDEF